MAPQPHAPLNPNATLMRRCALRRSRPSRVEGERAPREILLTVREGKQSPHPDKLVPTSISGASITPSGPDVHVCVRACAARACAYATTLNHPQEKRRATRDAGTALSGGGAPSRGRRAVGRGAPGPAGGGGARRAGEAPSLPRPKASKTRPCPAWPGPKVERPSGTVASNRRLNRYAQRQHSYVLLHSFIANRETASPQRYCDGYDRSARASSRKKTNASL